jgi:hypothetical protein
MWDVHVTELKNDQRSSKVEKSKKGISQIVHPIFKATQHPTEPSTNVELLQEDQLRRR